MRIHTPSSDNHFVTVTREEMEKASNTHRCFYPTWNMIYTCLYLFNEDVRDGYLELISVTERYNKDSSSIGFNAYIRRWLKKRYPQARAFFQGDDSLFTYGNYIREE